MNEQSLWIMPMNRGLRILKEKLVPFQPFQPEFARMVTECMKKVRNKDEAFHKEPQQVLWKIWEIPLVATCFLPLKQRISCLHK